MFKKKVECPCGCGKKLDQDQYLQLSSASKIRKRCEQIGVFFLLPEAGYVRAPEHVEEASRLIREGMALTEACVALAHASGGEFGRSILPHSLRFGEWNRQARALFENAGV